MRNFVLVLMVYAVLLGCKSAQTLIKAEESKVLTHIDLVKVDQDRVLVTLNPGAFSSDLINFYIPKTVPGTYSLDNYGQYIEDFKAFDYKGEELQVTQSDSNSWSIATASNLDKISYYVNDTFDQENSSSEAVFSPAGTNIKAGENYMLNLHGFVGYFEGLKEIPYEIIISVPEGLTATTSLPQATMSAGESGDKFLAARYFEVIDNPIMYARPNSTSFTINNIEVTMGVYSPNDVYKASDFKAKMEEMMRAQKAFLGDTDSTREYNILLYLSTMDQDDASGFGALEHHTSTVVVFPEQMPKEGLEQIMVDVVSHEFFHIVTPLNIHSKEIHYFDYNEPKMSEHLWLYEGTTEYFANLFQIQQGLIDESDFYNRIIGKIDNSGFYDDAMSFIRMSKNIYEDPYKDNYANVYEKGALINMCLDLLIREWSNGEKGVLWLMKELSAKYDALTPFDDPVLIDEITAMTSGDIGIFFKTHVQGETPIDYEAFFAKVGLSTDMAEEESGYFFKGNIPYIDVDPSDNSIFVRQGIELNSFFTSLGIQGGDIIISIDGSEIDLESIRPIIGQSFGWNPEKEIQIEVQRADEKVQLKGPVGRPTVKVRSLVPLTNTTDEQLRLRETWLKG